MKSVEISLLKSVAIKMASAGEVPSNILAFGVPGSGKTTTGENLASELNAKLLKIQCSRITDSVIEEIESFCRSSSPKKAKVQTNLNHFFGEDYNFGMVMLDEIEQLGGKTSIDRLRPIIDNYKDTIFFYATTNYIDRVPDGIKDRFIASEIKGQEISLRQQDLLSRMGL